MSHILHHTRGARVLALALAVAVLGTGGPADAQRDNRRAKVDVAAEIERLQESAPKVAAEAAVRLGEAGDTAAVDALLDALALGLHPKVAAAALDGLAAAGDERAFDTVAWYTRHRDARARAAAVRAMGALDEGAAEQHILAALRDGDESVRAAAAAAVAERELKMGIEPLMALLEKGDEAAAPALASMADPDLARAIAELIGSAPNTLVARALGMTLVRSDFGPETARVEVVRALGKIPGSESLEQLTSYVDSVPEKPPRQSRREAEALIEQRLTGGM